MERMPLEVWETATDSTVFVARTDQFGRETLQGVGGRVGAKLQITVEDREYNQQKAADPSLDPFLNGLLSPVKVHGAPEQIASPNALSRAEMVAVFAKTGRAFHAALDRITSEVTLRTLRRVASEVDAKQSQIAELDRRLEPFTVVGKQQSVYKELQPEGPRPHATVE